MASDRRAQVPIARGILADARRRLARAQRVGDDPPPGSVWKQRRRPGSPGLKSNRAAREKEAATISSPKRHAPELRGIVERRVFDAGRFASS